MDVFKNGHILTYFHLGGELSGRQVVVVPSGGARLKVVGGVGVSGVVRAPSPAPSAQLLQLRQRPAPPLTKLTLAPGGSKTLFLFYSQNDKRETNANI